MAHEAQRVFFEAVKGIYPEFFKDQRVLEVGSLNINGTVRDFFENCAYTGIDIGPGPGVDIVISGADYKAPDESFDIAVSAECFEHNPEWRETFSNMVRLVRPGGLIAFTCAGEGRPEHGTSNSDIGSSPLTVSLGWEYYRNLTPEDFSDLTDEVDGIFVENSTACDLYFVGVKGDSLRDTSMVKDIKWEDVQ